MKKTYLALVSIIILVMTSLGSIAWGQSSISLVGDGTEFGWPPFPGDDPNDPIQLERIGDTDTWVAFGIELYGGPVKFRENNTWDDDDWGGVWPSGNTTAANINTEEGIYNVFLNLANNTFGFQEAGEVTFRLDLSQNRLADLNPRVFLAGNVQTPDWQEPGTNTAYQLEESGTEPGIYEITFFAELGSREFKFFALPSDIANQTEAGWEYGEWAGGPNRSVDIQAGQTYEFTWGPARVLNTTADFNLSTNNNPSFQIQESIPGTLPETLSSAIEGIALLNDDSEILINLEPSDWTRDGNTLSINSAIIQDQEPSEGQSIPFLIRFDRSTLENDVVLVQVDIIDFDSFALSSPANEAAFDTNESGNIVFEWDELSEDDPSYTVYVGLASADLSDPDQRLLTLAADDGGELNRLTIDRQSLFDDLVAAANIDLSNISSLSFSWNVEANFSADGEPQTALSTNGPRTFTLIPPRYEVAFQVDMSQSTAYDPNSENIFLSGTITDPAFQLPGSNQDLQLSAEGDGVYTLTLELFPGEYQYKYFRVPIGGETFDNGEWVGDPNRSVTITNNMTINDVWGPAFFPQPSADFDLTEQENVLLAYEVNRAGTEVAQLFLNDVEVDENNFFNEANNLVIDGDFLAGILTENEQTVELEVRFESSGERFAIEIQATNPPTFTLTLSGDNATLNGAGEYIAGEEVTVSALPDASFSFVHWLDEEESVVSGEAEFSFIMPNRAVELTAVMSVTTFDLIAPAAASIFDSQSDDPIEFEWQEFEQADYRLYIGLVGSDLNLEEDRLASFIIEGEESISLAAEGLLSDLVAAVDIDLNNVNQLDFIWNVVAVNSDDSSAPFAIFSSNGPRTFSLIPPRYEVTFQVDMSQSTAYDPSSENIFLSGTITDPVFQLPGSNQDLQLSAEGDGIYTLTLELFPGEYQYKYFRVPIGGETFDNGEWVGDPNRSVTITDNMTINDVWGPAFFPQPSADFDLTEQENVLLAYEVNRAGTEVAQLFLNDVEVDENNFFNEANNLVIDGDFLAGILTENEQTVELEVRFESSGERFIVEIQATNPPTFTLTLSGNNAILSGAGDYTSGTQVTVSATPDSGYEFVLWEDESQNLLSENSEFLFTMPNRDVVLTAIIRLEEGDEGDDEGDGDDGDEGDADEDSGDDGDDNGEDGGDEDSSDGGDDSGDDDGSDDGDDGDDGDDSGDDGDDEDDSGDDGDDGSDDGDNDGDDNGEEEETITSVTESLLSEVKIYPNPTRGLVNIKVDVAISEVKVISMTGQLLYQQTGIKQPIDLSSLPRGTYLLELSSDEQHIRKRIVLQ